MLWFVVIFLVLVSVPAIFISQNNRDALMDAMAMHERLQRTAPEDPLAQLGPTEFQRAYERAQKSRSKPIMVGMGLGLLGGFFVGFIGAFVIAYMLDDPDMFGGLFTLIFLGSVLFGVWRGFSKRTNVFEEMRKNLQLH